jgi:hypothetical protein
MLDIDGELNKALPPTLKSDNGRRKLSEGFQQESLVSSARYLATYWFVLCFASSTFGESLVQPPTNRLATCFGCLAEGAPSNESGLRDRLIVAVLQGQKPLQ